MWGYNWGYYLGLTNRYPQICPAENVDLQTNIQKNSGYQAKRETVLDLGSTSIIQLKVEPQSGTQVWGQGYKNLKSVF